MYIIDRLCIQGGGYRTMKSIIWDDAELASIRIHGETCPAVARQAMERSNINFDDIEEINGVSKEYRWGSDADRKYRKSAVNKAVRKVASDPLSY